jgi:hypothetical protein
VAGGGPVAGGRGAPSGPLPTRLGPDVHTRFLVRVARAHRVLQSAPNWDRACTRDEPTTPSHKTPVHCAPGTGHRAPGVSPSITVQMTG